MKRVPPNFPMNRKSRRDVRAKRVRIKPMGLTYVLDIERRAAIAFKVA